MWNIAPELDDDKGTSVVLMHSEKGQKILEQIRNRCVVRAISLQEASRENPAMLKSTPGNSDRETVLAWIRKGDFRRCEKMLKKASKSGLRKMLRRFLRK